MKNLVLPTIACYGPYAGNYGSHALRVSIGPIDVWYSYETPIAFHVSGHERVVRQNDWSTTTGKHLNTICSNKKSRVTSEEFERLWKAQVEPLLKAA